jgi:hypothetical protein
MTTLEELQQLRKEADLYRLTFQYYTNIPKTKPVTPTAKQHHVTPIKIE